MNPFEKMIQLTPLDKTVAGQELIQMGMEKGVIEGLQKDLEKDKLVGKIHPSEPPKQQCKVQNDCGVFTHFAFCTLHFALF